MRKILLCVMAAIFVASSLSGCMALGGVGALLGAMQNGANGEKQEAIDAPQSPSQGQSGNIQDTTPDSGKVEEIPNQPEKEESQPYYEENTEPETPDEPTVFPEEEPSEIGELISYDGEFSVTKIKGWKRMGKEINTQSELTICDATENYGMIFIREDKSLFGSEVTAQDMAEALSKNIVASAYNAEIVRNDPFYADGYHGAVCWVNATVSGMRLTYQITVMDRGDYFLAITAWSLEKDATKGEEYFIEIRHSYKER